MYTPNPSVFALIATWRLFSGEYRVGIKFNDQHIPDSPHKVYISPAMGDAHKLEVAQFPDSGVQPDKPYTFLVRKNGAKGELDGKVIRSFPPAHNKWLEWLYNVGVISNKSPCEREEVEEQERRK